MSTEHSAPKTAPAAKPATPPAAKPHTPATTSPTKPATETKAEDWNEPTKAEPVKPVEPKAESPRSEGEAAPGSTPKAETPEEPKRRGRPPKDPNAASAPKAEAAPPKPVAEMGLGELLREKEKAVAIVQKAHESLGSALPRLLEVAAAIKSKLA